MGQSQTESRPAGSIASTRFKQLEVTSGSATFTVVF